MKSYNYVKNVRHYMIFNHVILQMSITNYQVIPESVHILGIENG